MNSAQLLAQFDRISDAPDAISRLRRFVLDLAVRGKLVEQDPRDEPALDLLGRIETEKLKLIKEGKLKRQELLSPINEDELPFPVPHGWQPTRLAVVAACLDYMREPINSTERDQRIAGKIPSELFPYYGATQQQGWIDDYIFDEELVLLGEDGVPFFDDFRSKAYLISGKTWVNNHAHVFRGILVSPAFLVHYLNTFDYKGRVAGATRSKLNQAKAVDIPIILPPLAEQHRIVAKVDELMALCDRLAAAQAERESRRDRLVDSSLNILNNGADADAFRDHARFYFNHIPRLTTKRDHIQQLRQTVLNLAVCGKLVPQDPHDEPSSLLYERLNSQLAKVRQIEGARPRRDLLPAAEGFFSADVFPPSWVLTNFDKLNSIISGVAKGKDLRGLKTATYPYLRVANVQRGYLDLAVVKELEICADEFSRYQLRRGDVLMTEGGDWDKLGRAAIWNDEVPNCIHQNHIYRIRPANKEELLSEWIVLFANSPLGRTYFEGASKQTTNLASINMTQLRSCPLPLPPIMEQHRIVAKVLELMTLCDRLEAQLTTTQTESRRLLEAVLHEALTEADHQELAATSCRSSIQEKECR